jgi:hypothetical protein
MPDPINPPSTPIEELRGPFVIEIGLDWFFDRFTRGVHGFATVSKDYGQILAAKDKEEKFIHVDYPEETPSLAYVYPIDLWIASVKRWDENRKISEANRQARFLREALAREIQAKYERRETEIGRVISIFNTRFPLFCNKQSRKNLRILTISLLQGKGDRGVRLKLGIDDATVAEFLELPQPEPTEEEELLELVKEKPSTEVKVS